MWKRVYYDHENRLTDVNDGSDEPVASYKYDWAGRRVRKITYYNGDVNETIDYLYDGWHCIAEYNGDTCLRRFYYGPLIDEPVMMRDVAANEKYYYHYDGLGSVTALSDSDGDIVEQYSYDIFGGATVRDANDEIRDTSSVGNPYMFTGRRYDEESGLYYYRYRHYDPAIGRFMQTDPLGYYYSMNLYEYCWNDPVNWLDLYGLSRYWRWDDWYDWVLFPIHLPFDAGVGIGDKILGTPGKAKRVINAPGKIRQKHARALDNAMEGGDLPKTAGPVKDFKNWAEDTKDVATTVPGTSATGPLPTEPIGTATGVVIGGIVDTAEQEKKCEKEKQKQPQ